MSLTVGEDTYISLADADTYFSNFYDSSDWDAATDAEKEAALRASTQYVDKHYTFIGDHPETLTQDLAWPRYNALDKQGRLLADDEIPQPVKDATAYLAQEVLRKGILKAKDRGGSIESVKAGSVQVQWNSFASSQPSYDYADLLLKNITIGGKGQRPLLKG